MLLFILAVGHTRGALELTTGLFVPTRGALMVTRGALGCPHASMV